MEIVSLVATATLNGPLDLEILRNVLPGSKFSNKKNGWLMYRLKPELRYIAFYRSGKFLITGKDLQNNINDVSQRILKYIIEAGFNRAIIQIKVHNIVAKGKIVNNSTLESFLLNNSNKSEYEPEQFPGLIFRDWGLTFLLFSTGSTIITGAKNIEQLEFGFEEFTKLVQKA